MNHTAIETEEYTKEQLHEAFTVEHQARKSLNKTLNDQEKTIASYRQALKETREDLLSSARVQRVLFYKYHILCNQTLVGTYKEQAQQIEVFFDSDWEILESNSGYIAYERLPSRGVHQNEIFIWYTYSKTRPPQKDYLKMLVELIDAYDNVKFSTAIDVLKNSSYQDSKDPEGVLTINKKKFQRLIDKMKTLKPTPEAQSSNYSLKKD